MFKPLEKKLEKELGGQLSRERMKKLKKLLRYTGSTIKTFSSSHGSDAPEAGPQAGNGPQAQAGNGPQAAKGP